MFSNRFFISGETRTETETRELIVCGCQSLTPASQIKIEIKKNLTSTVVVRHCASMRDAIMEKADYRSSVRLNPKTAKRLEKVAESSGLTVSDVVRLMIVKSLPDMEAGRIDFGGVKKAA
jgi:hypothetical protein